MKKIVLAIFLVATLGAQAQTAVPAAAVSGKGVTPAKKTDKAVFGADSKIEGPITTEIYSDQAFFDANKNTGVFTGRVKVIDPRFTLQSDKLTVYLRHGEDQGLEKAIADGNVGLVRERPNPEGGTPQRAVGRGDHAVYTANDGNVELTGTPKVQQGLNMHVATSAETVMVINQNGQLTTRGPSRTEIRQELQNENRPAPEPKND